MSQSVEQSDGRLYCAENASEVVQFDADNLISDFTSPSQPEDSVINQLIDSEPHHMPHPDYLRLCQDHSVDLTARQDSINWILKVHAHYHFRPVTAFLSVNYFDRFLSVHSLSAMTFMSKS
ncbi:unnamed protein product [Ilex paraguariensis]|uniref:Cyclin N-terminal domain-containing protein n=1 Tax=Ilex paraguariensis TaxID=185542 RepID=A0ABC8RLB1_9AQUA